MYDIYNTFPDAMYQFDLIPWWNEEIMIIWNIFNFDHKMWNNSKKITDRKILKTSSERYNSHVYTRTSCMFLTYWVFEL